MLPIPQNRKFMRMAHELPLLYKHKGEETFFNGIMRIYSTAGICFETDLAIKPGTEIFIIFRNDITTPDPYDNRDANYAEVEWCKATANCDALFFMVGVKFFDL